MKHLLLSLSLLAITVFTSNSVFGQTTTQGYQYVGSELQYTYTATHINAIAHSNPASTKVIVNNLPSGYFLKEVEIRLGDGSNMYSGSLSNLNGKLKIQLKDPSDNITEISNNIAFSESQMNLLSISFRNNNHLKTLSVSADNRSIDTKERLYGIFKTNTAWSTSASNGNWFILTTLASNTSYSRKIKSVVLIFGNTDSSQVITAGKNCSNAKEIQNNILYKSTNSGCDVNQSYYPPIDGSTTWNGAKNTTAWFYFIATSTRAKIRVSSFDPKKKMQSTVAYTSNGNCSTVETNYTLKKSTRHVGSDAVLTRFNYDYIFTDLVIGKKYFLLVDGDGAAGKVGDISEFTILLEVIKETALPISLLSFDATPSKKGVTLNWSTASERNNDYFTISRSSDLENWEEVGTVKGSGSVNYQLDYDFIDIAPLDGISYYQLKQTDYNGEYESFDPVSVSINANHLSNTVVVYPNPTKAGFDIQVYSKKMIEAQVSIHSMTGRNVITQTTQLVKGKNSISMKDERLDRGVYLVTIQFEDGTNSMTKLVVE